MTDEQLIAKVAEMRKCQREYFRNREQAVLQMSARLEQQVDRELWERRSGQKHLFEGDK